MKDEHIIDMLERVPFGSLTADELATIRTHAAVCPDCQRAYDAARISALLLKERVAASFAPSPFFQTRVLAALRERQAETEVPALKRLWQTAGALVSTMALTVAALATLTFFTPTNTQPLTEPQALAAVNNYTAEDLVFTPDEAADAPVSDDQVLSTLYETDEAQ
jgi:Putative zinc-finger